jgi:isocitrate/isopropylmalate dehydrogenase
VAVEERIVDACAMDVVSRPERREAVATDVREKRAVTPDSGGTATTAACTDAEFARLRT